MTLLDERILIRARLERDAILTQETLASTGLVSEICPSMEEFSRRMVEGAGVGLLAEETLSPGDLSRFISLLAEQPTWSDFNVIVIAAYGQSSEISSKRYKLLQGLGNFTILERPFHAETLLTVIYGGLRARRHQYEARDLLLQRQAQEEAITQLNESLENKVTERTRELTRSHEALGQAQKLEAIGRLAGGVAHDFNNLMTGILGIVQEVSTDLGPNDPHHEDLADVLDAAGRAAQVAKQLLAFGRRQVVIPTLLNANEVIQGMKKSLARVLPAHVQLKLDLESHLRKVSMDKGQLEQILLNLVLNARDAIHMGGKITITSSNVDLGSDGSRASIDLIPGPYMQLSVADTGRGMNEDALKHLFEPFYSTKDTGTDKGTGLGLATVYGIVKQHGGDISASSEPGIGTTFLIHFPCVTTTAECQAPPLPEPERVARGSETILVTEDEDIVRKIAVRALQKRGYHVLEARDAREALKVSNAHAGRIDLLLTDVIMPGMNGRELAAAVHVRRPGTRILYMSGYSQDVIARQGILEPGMAFIVKAFSTEKLCHTVRDVLDDVALSAPKRPVKRARIAPRKKSKARLSRSR